MKRVMWVVVMVLALGSQSAWASRSVIHEAAESHEYGSKVGGMIARGIVNASTCFMDLLVDVVHETQSGPPLVGTLVGVGKGVACTSLRALSGAVDLVTFWVPGFNGFPVSDSYDNCIPVAPPAHAAMAVPPAAPAPAAPAVEREAPAPSPSPSVTVAPKAEQPRYTK